MRSERSFPAASRLRTSVEYARVRQQGRRHHTRHFSVIVLANSAGRPRLGMTVSRKVGNAVCRNRLKRWLREYFRHALQPRGSGLDISIIAKPGAGQLEHGQLHCELDRLFIRLETGNHA